MTPRENNYCGERTERRGEDKRLDSDIMGRTSVVLSVQNWLGEGEETRKSSNQPAYFSVGMSGECSCVPFHPLGPS